MLSDESPLTLEWTLRQPKDAEWCWPSHHFYPCGCKQDDWDDDYEVEDQPDWCCELCNPREFTRREREARDGDRRVAHVEDEAFAARTRWLKHYGWIKTSTMENLTQIMREFYITPLIEQLNKPAPFLQTIVAEKNLLYAPGTPPDDFARHVSLAAWFRGRLRKMGRVVS